MGLFRMFRESPVTFDDRCFPEHPAVFRQGSIFRSFPATMPKRTPFSVFFRKQTSLLTVLFCP
jgi:hypothetical protein